MAEVVHLLALCLSMLDTDTQRALFLKLHRTWEQRLLQYAHVVLKNPVLTQEAVQQCWLQVAASFSKIEKKFENQWDTIDGYLVVIVRHICMDILRQERRTAQLPPDWDPPAPAAGTGSVLERIVALIRTMPPTYREILELKFVLEYTNREIAKKMSLNESTVATRVERGRKLLMQALREEGIEP